MITEASGCGAVIAAAPQLYPGRLTPKRLATRNNLYRPAMNHTFTGSSRRPRNVNLSGQNKNPFGKASQNAVANAQQDRVARQLERRRLEAAMSIQKTWRRFFARKTASEAQRRQWDTKERARYQSEPTSYLSAQESLSQLHLLLGFFSTQNSASQDILRLEWYFLRHQKTISSIPCTGGPWPLAYLRLENCCLEALERDDGQHSPLLQRVLQFLIKQIPSETARNSRRYYHALRRSPQLMEFDTVVSPLQTISKTTLYAYIGFATEFLTIPNGIGSLDHNVSIGLEAVAGSINCKILGSALSHLLQTHKEPKRFSEDLTGRLWLLSRFIYFYRQAYKFQTRLYAADRDFVNVVAILLLSVADNIRMEPSDEDDGPERDSFLADAFIREQISSLVNQESVGSILRATDLESRAFANYILTILRLFPRRSDEIQMWLYLGLSPSNDVTTRSSMSAVKYFWQSTRATKVYKLILAEPRAAVQLLQTNSFEANNVFSQYSGDSVGTLEDEWKIILIFIELYTFVLKVMDDEEFFSAGHDGLLDTKRTSVSSLSRDSALRLGDVQELTTFLKHLGFTMYYNARDISGTTEEESESLALLFRHSNTPTARFINDNHEKKPSEPGIAGIKGITLDYMKGAVTGLLRMIYERDSRRPFMPKNHWLMTSRFDMDNFIDAVIEEEERRHQLQDDIDDNPLAGDEDDQLQEQSSSILGAGRNQNTPRLQVLRQQQRQASKKRYLQAVAPRLEILQNMPFLIPFETRVKIFRRFIHMDMVKRRHGIMDPEEWRMLAGSQDGHPRLSRHHAKIRREHEFEDAFEQYYQLGSALKEPIQITFVDQFDTVEAGIDGGGVTKEFLTSVTNQVFAPVQEGDINLFAENDQHLLYPNPASVDQQHEVLRTAGLIRENPEYKEAVTSLLQRYEFLGRVIGKCLYEGILIDVRFAGFFLLKWALTGGTGSAPKESGYRANINDLREFDEGLYQGLLQLKNYPGNVEEDFNLNFAIDDTISLPPAVKTITRDLKPNGSTLPVTSSNRLVYISYVARHRLQAQPYAQTSAFLRGLASIILPSWLSMFNQNELQTLVSGGAAPISIPDLRAHTVYGGVYVVGDDKRLHPSVELFWEVMESLPDADRRKVLKFVTSTPRAPLLGFGALRPSFSIRDSGDESRLPSTSTCVNLLKLPMYKTAGKLREKLLQAVNAGAGFDLS